MTTKKSNAHKPDKRLAAVCGLFCPACTIFIATQEDPERREKLAASKGWPVEQIHCDGCRAEKRYYYCETCEMFACAAEKGIDFCGECEVHPCDALKAFQVARPHRLELWDAQARIQEVGYEQWFEEMLAHYRCPKCGTLNSAYDLSCRTCGAHPSCAYVALHEQEILEYLEK